MSARDEDRDEEERPTLHVAGVVADAFAMIGRHVINSTTEGAKFMRTAAEIIGAVQFD